MTADPMHQSTMTTCPDCAGTGGGHPDNTGYRCHRCGGSGGVPETTRPCVTHHHACDCREALAE